jgi:hypothetical protein
LDFSCKLSKLPFGLLARFPPGTRPMLGMVYLPPVELCLSGLAGGVVRRIVVKDGVKKGVRKFGLILRS